MIRSQKAIKASIHHEFTVNMQEVKWSNKLPYLIIDTEGGGRRWLGLTLLLTWFCVVPSEERKVIVESIVLMVMFFIF